MKLIKPRGLKSRIYSAFTYIAESSRGSRGAFVWDADLEWFSFITLHLRHEWIQHDVRCTWNMQLMNVNMLSFVSFNDPGLSKDI